MNPQQTNKGKSVSAEGAGRGSALLGGGGPLTFTVGVGHGEGIVLCQVQEGERGLAIQQSRQRVPWRDGVVVGGTSEQTRDLRTWGPTP